MRAPFSRLLAAGLGVALCAGSARAQDSMFGIRGLGFLGRPVSARAAGSAGGFSLFDPGSAINPASLYRWRTMVGWAVSVPSTRTFSDNGSSVSLGSTRFPLVGFATQPGQRLVVALTIGDYLNRTWSTSQSDSILLRGKQTGVTDTRVSLGGVSDIRAAAAWQLSERVILGMGLHALTGSARSQVTRHFSDSSFTDFSDVALVDFTGRSVSFGLTALPLPRVEVGASVRFNSSLTARKSSGEQAVVRLPTEAAFGAAYTPGPGIALAVSAQYAGWATATPDLRATGDSAANVWSVSVGGEFDTFRRGQGRVPLRLGWRTRELPFAIVGHLVRETAVSGGTSLDFAGAHTTLDLGLEHGTRSAGALKETFTNGYLGLIVRP